MCGINGIIDISHELNNYQLSRMVHSMNEKIVHRGPDDSGVFARQPVAVGMRRLSIIDLTLGKQPFLNDDESISLVFNGEIYNYKALKNELVKKNHIFKTNSDTEVILKAYIEYGTEAFNKLNGMFAFSITDYNKQKIYLVRDRVGEKPLYYYKKNDIFIFGSELKSLMSLDTIPKKISKIALNQYLSLNYIPAPLSIYEDVYKVMPGHYLDIEFNGTFEEKSYWQLSFNQSEIISDYDEAKRLLRETLFKSVEEMMVSDVPIGTFLSGGIDSTIITGIASKVSKEKVNTFNIGFHDKEYDESDRAKLTSEFHNTNHHVYYLDYKDVLPNLDKILKNIDEPFADSSYIPTHMVSLFARDHVKTILTGDAGDELFGGYSKYLIGHYSDKYNKTPKVIRSIFEKMVYSFPDNNEKTRKVRKVIENSKMSLFDQRVNMMTLSFKQNELNQLLKKDYQITDSLKFIKDIYYNKDLPLDEVNQSLYLDFKVVLEGDMLHKVDRSSMLASLETRAPILHKDMIELAYRIPSEFKINKSNKKIILKDAFSDLIPKKLLNASKKGFGIPIGKWLKNELKEELIELTNESFIEKQNIFEFDFIKTTLDDLFTDKKNRTSEIWAIYIFQKWYRDNLL